MYTYKNTSIAKKLLYQSINYGCHFRSDTFAQDIFRLDIGKSILSVNTSKSLMALGVILYLMVGCLGILLGGNFLEYNDLSIY